MTYLDLRHSKDPATQDFADRYFNLVRVQEWRDKSGKKVRARYVTHDPDLTWVKLEIAKGSGTDRAVEERTVRVDQLSPACQSRVREIATRQAKLDELLAAEKEKQSG
jgi:hypothetical protein